MPGLTLAACDRLAIVDANAIEYLSNMLRWKACMIRRVMAGFVCKVQVRWLLRMSARCLLY